MNLVLVKRLGKAGIMFSDWLGEKCICALSLSLLFVIVLGFQLFIKRILLFVLWQGR